MLHVAVERDVPRARRYVEPEVIRRRVEEHPLEVFEAHPPDSQTLEHRDEAGGADVHAEPRLGTCLKLFGRHDEVVGGQQLDAALCRNFCARQVAAAGEWRARGEGCEGEVSRLHHELALFLLNQLADLRKLHFLLRHAVVNVKRAGKPDRIRFAAIVMVVQAQVASGKRGLYRDHLSAPLAMEIEPLEPFGRSVVFPVHRSADVNLVDKIGIAGLIS